ncbi:hypothetical protein Tco_1375262 [Tanacetum coccineum]
MLERSSGEAGTSKVIPGSELISAGASTTSEEPKLNHTYENILQQISYVNIVTSSVRPLDQLGASYRTTTYKLIGDMQADNMENSIANDLFKLLGKKRKIHDNSVQTYGLIL